MGKNLEALLAQQQALRDKIKKQKAAERQAVRSKTRAAAQAMGVRLASEHGALTPEEVTWLSGVLESVRVVAYVRKLAEASVVADSPSDGALSITNARSQPASDQDPEDQRSEGGVR